MLNHLSREERESKMMLFTSLLLLAIAAFATGEIGQKDYPVMDPHGLKHGGRLGGGGAHHLKGGGVVVHGGGFLHGGGHGKKGVVYPPKKGGFLHGGGHGKKGVVYPHHHHPKGGFLHGGGHGKKGVVYPHHHHPKGGFLHGGGHGKKGVVYPHHYPKGGFLHGGGHGKKGVVYPHHHHKGGFLHGGGHGKKGVVYPPHYPKKGGFLHGGGHGKKGVVYPPHYPKKGGFLHGGGHGHLHGGGFIHGGIGKKLVIGGGKYPHGNVKKVGGHGYFPDKAPGLKGYGKGIYYKKVANVGPMPLGCPYGWQYYHGSCYYFSRDKLSWWHAYAKCNFMGGYLAMVNYAHENSYLKLMCKKMHFHGGAWFGLNDVLFPKSHTWYWGFGKKGCKWFDWFGKGPKFRGTEKNCVCFKEDYHYQWAISVCTTKMYYICELNPKKPCKCGY